MINYYNLIEITKSELDALISASNLKLGSCYKITDRGDRGITLTAISTNKLSLDGIRNMLCPKTYKIETLDGNIWKGVWNPLKTAAINDLFIWGGLVWKNLTGAIGTATTNVALDLVNWIEIPKSTFINNEYVELTFRINYDYQNDWILSQEDSKGNKCELSKKQFDDYYDTLIIKNHTDITDWNYNTNLNNELSNNKCIAIFNNVEPCIISYNIQGIIYNNKVDQISDNVLKGTDETKYIRNNIGGGIFDNISSRIYSNTDTAIVGNIVKRIYSNTVGDITNNKCDKIYSNVNNNASIFGNNLNGSIFLNTSLSIFYNHSTYGNINDNTNINQAIEKNNILGDIHSNTCNGIFNNTCISIYSNINNGNINDNHSKNIYSNSGTGHITNSWDKNLDISSRVLTASIDYFPYKKYVALLTQTGTSAPTAVVLEDTIGIVGGDYGRLNSGEYTITKTDAFPSGKTFSSIHQSVVADDQYVMDLTASRNSDNVIDITFTSAGVFTDANVLATNPGQLEIRVYQ